MADEQARGKHPIQRLMDNPWLLLALGFFVPTVSYTLWGLWELMAVGPAPGP